MADFVMDFLATVGDNKEYDRHNWGWDNLPTFETMLEIMNKHKEKEDEHSKM